MIALARWTHPLGAAGRSIIAAILPAPCFSSSISTTGNPLVANYSLNAPAGSSVRVQFGLDTAYGYWTSTVAAPAGGGPVSILVAGMFASTTYHMRAVIQMANGWTLYDRDQTFATGALPTNITLPTLTVNCSAAKTPAQAWS
jgi:hypothetical protein